ncbi:MAG TPA: DinB family protein [Candidatus Dormibacteraeota bacterium]|nr:DinB family protein [Candidatus Dormibacteraeota bacterium]
MDPQAERLLRRLDRAWSAFTESYAGLPDEALLEPGAVGEWSVKDVMAHVSVWEEEALRYLPVIAAGGTPPRYAAQGGIDAFNTRMAERWRALSLEEVRRRLDETHRRLVDFIRSAPTEQLRSETRVRRRLRLDTYGHYALHANDIRAWRGRRAER